MQGTSDTLKVITPADHDELKRIATELAKPRMVRWFWEDTLRTTSERLTLSFVMLFANPYNLVIDLDGDGVFCFTRRDVWRAFLYAAIWGPKASRKPEMHRTAIGAAMKHMNLLAVESIVNVENRASNAAVKRAGFKKRGTIPNMLSYNDKQVAGNWWEITRADLGLGDDDGQ